MEKYINIRFDDKLAPDFFANHYAGPRKHIGEKYGSFVVQFRSIKQAERACKEYRAHVANLGWISNNVNYTDCVCADIGNHSQWHVWKLDELKKSFFYLGQA